MTFDPARVVRTFADRQPQLFRGDRNAAAGFLAMVEKGAIHGSLPHDHAQLGKGTMLPGTSSRAGIKAAASVDASTR